MRSRDVGRFAISSCEKFVAICAVFVSVSAELRDDGHLLGDLRRAEPSLRAAATCVGASTTLRVWVWNPGEGER